MGCSESLVEGHVHVPPMNHELLTHFHSLKWTTSDVRKLYLVFATIDVVKDKKIGLDELLAYLELEKSAFTKRLFGVFDEDGSGEIDFNEFALSIWNFCALSKGTMGMFIFDLYDVDGSGKLTAGEVTKLVEDIFGNEEAKRNMITTMVLKELKDLENTGDVMKIGDFATFLQTHEGILFPAIMMQHTLQRKTMGTKFWERQAEERNKKTGGKYVPIKRFLMQGQSEDGLAAHGGGRPPRPKPTGAPSRNKYLDPASIGRGIGDLTNSARMRLSSGLRDMKGTLKGRLRPKLKTSAVAPKPAPTLAGIHELVESFEHVPPAVEKEVPNYHHPSPGKNDGKILMPGGSPAQTPRGQDPLHPDDHGAVVGGSAVPSRRGSAASIGAPPSRHGSIVLDSHKHDHGHVRRSSFDPAAGISPSPQITPRDHDYGKCEGNRRHSRTTESMGNLLAPGLEWNKLGEGNRSTPQQPRSRQPSPHPSVGDLKDLLLTSSTGSDAAHAAAVDGHHHHHHRHHSTSEAVDAAGAHKRRPSNGGAEGPLGNVGYGKSYEAGARRESFG